MLLVSPLLLLPRSRHLQVLGIYTVLGIADRLSFIE